MLQKLNVHEAGAQAGSIFGFNHVFAYVMCHKYYALIMIVKEVGIL